MQFQGRVTSLEPSERLFSGRRSHFSFWIINSFLSIMYDKYSQFIQKQQSPPFVNRPKPLMPPQINWCASFAGFRRSCKHDAKDRLARLFHTPNRTATDEKFQISSPIIGETPALRAKMAAVRNRTIEVPRKPTGLPSPNAVQESHYQAMLSWYHHYFSAGYARVECRAIIWSVVRNLTDRRKCRFPSFYVRLKQQ